MKITIISLFPEMFDGVLNASMMRKAQDIGVVEFVHVPLRDFGIGPRAQVDDIPYGGGDGMVLKPEPIISAIEHAKKHSPDAIVILPTPRGKTYKQSDAKRLAINKNDLIFVCARYEGYDERITKYIDEQIRVGDYILTGGELPTMTIIDSVVRLLPGVLGGETSAELESFQADDKSIEHPHYTRPEDFRGDKVPDVLLSGHHSEIKKWRDKNSK
ncbi:MAG TPA: tRNA (guanosine(37)-N1)-methyltransferase TrmD [Candidatus Saccharibacteria bacterium]|nr:tRNA (guanosine(37)-N1)-methyltransferase TrmD [Candidatus Saccharibacteria bacterium]